MKKLLVVLVSAISLGIAGAASAQSWHSNRDGHGYNRSFNRDGERGDFSGRNDRGYRQNRFDRHVDRNSGRNRDFDRDRDWRREESARLARERAEWYRHHSWWDRCPF